MVVVLLLLLSFLWQSKQNVGAMVLPDWIIRMSQAVPIAGKLFPAQGVVMGRSSHEFGMGGFFVFGHPVSPVPIH